MSQAESISPVPDPQHSEDGGRGAPRYRVDWVRVPVGVAVNTAACAGSGRWTVLGPDGLGLCAAQYDGFAALAEALSAGARVPEAVFVPCSALADPAGSITNLLKAWLADERLAAQDTRLVFVTGGGLAAQSAEAVAALAGSPVWGQVLAAQHSYPGRFVIVDIDDRDSSLLLLPAAVATGEPHLVVRAGVVRAPRLEPGLLDLAEAFARLSSDGVGAELTGGRLAAAGTA